MLRGVNKCIIEISGTGSKYFEKALIFVKPEYAALSQSRLQSGAKDFLDQIEQDEAASAPGYRRVSGRGQHSKKRRLRPWVTALLCVAAVITYSFLIRSI